MKDKTVLITGANSGIGLATARKLAELGAAVVLVCRDAARGAAAREEVAGVATGAAPTLLLADLSSQASIRSLATEALARFPRIDVLINNAGAVFASRQTTVDSIERTFATNHLAPFLLTHLPLDRVRAAPAGRIVNVSSRMHSKKLDFDNLQGERRYSAMQAYGQTKLVNILFTYSLAARLAGTTTTVNCLGPGLVASNFGRSAGGLIGLIPRLLTPFSLTPEQGALTSIHVASAPEVAGVTGKYFFKCQETATAPISYDPQVAARLWSVSEQLTKISDYTAPAARNA